MKAFRKVSALICVFFVIVSMMGISFAAEDSKPLYEKYGYQEDFEYEGEMIGHVLKSSVAKIVMFYSADIKYRPANFDTDEFGKYIEELRDEHPEYSEEKFKEELLNQLEENLDAYVSYGSSRSISTTVPCTGTGVVISEDGLIATNTHVVTIDDGTKQEIYAYALGQDISEDVAEALKEIESYGVQFTLDEQNQIYQYVTYDAYQHAVLSGEETALQVWFPAANGDTSESAAIKYDATVLEQGTAEGKDSLTQDAAILQINAQNLIALKLSDSIAEVNSSITAAGYPGASEEIFQRAGSSESVMSITVSKGEVSKQVAIDGAKYKALETSVRISGGNSGGPSVDNLLNIEGLNTYTLSDDARYAYMISAEYVAYMAEDYELIRDEVSKTFLMGIQALQNDYGKTAVECFEKVKTMQPNTPFIEPLIETAKKAPQNEVAVVAGEAKEEKGSAIGDFFKENRVLIIVAALAVVVVVAIIVTVVCIVKKKSKARKTNGSFGPAATPAVPVAPGRPVAPPPAARPATPPAHSAFQKGGENFTKPTNPTSSAVPTTPATPASGGSGLKMSNNFKKSDDLG